MATLDDVLNKKGADVKRPPPMPVGRYLFQVFGRPAFQDMSKAGKNDYVDFPIKVVQIGDDVSQEQIDQFPGGRSALVGHEPKGRSGARFYLSEASQYILVEWLRDALGISDDQPLKAMCFEAPGHLAWGEVQQEPTQDGKGMQSSIRSWAKHE